MSIHRALRNAEANDLPLLVVAAVSFVLFSSPGMLTMSLIRVSFGVTVSLSNIWFYSFLLSIVLYLIIFFLSRRKLMKALIRHGIISVFIISTALVLHFVFRVEYVSSLLAPFIISNP